MSSRAAWTAWLAGLAAVAWVAWGYVHGSPLALAMTLAIAAFHLLGGLELHRYQRATATLRAALHDDGAPLGDLAAWLERLDPTLRVPVRARLEGDRAGLPGPAMTPYLVGLLVLLGMLGTFLGMVVTLNGAVMALEGTTDLAAIRAALAAPVKGLGLAFGTSVAGVAASAMLGLVSALCRRDRQRAVMALDAAIATRLRVHTAAHERAAVLQALQDQARLVPEVVAQMQGLATQLQRQGDELGRQLLAGQDRFHAGAQAAYMQLATSVDRTLKDSLAEGSRAAAAGLQPLMQAGMAGIARETAAFHTHLVEATRQQMDGVTAAVQRQVDAVSAAAQQQAAGATHAVRLQTEAVALALQRQADGVAAAVQQQLDGTGAALRAQLEGVAAVVQQQVDGVAGQLAGTLAAADRAQAALQAEAAAREEQRLAAWTARLDAVAATLQAGWQQAAEAATAQQARVLQALHDGATALQAQGAEQARATIAELSRVAATAAEAPRAAAEVVAQLREQLSQTLARDNGLLDERARVMGTLDALLATVNHAATEQRTAVDALVASAEQMLQRAGAQADQRVAAAAERVELAAAHVADGAADVAGLGAAFGAAVQAFGDTSQALSAQLQRIESALDRSTARSDEQLAYYVAQAREIVDLTLSSQKQIVEDLHRLGARNARADAGAHADIEREAA